MEKTWTPNETQRDFMKGLADAPDGLTLAEINAKLGKEIKTGSINTLLTKGLVIADGEHEIVVQAKRKVKVYKLAK